MWNNFIKDFLDNELQKKEQKRIISEWQKEIKKNTTNSNRKRKKEEKEIFKKVIQINNLENTKETESIVINPGINSVWQKKEEEKIEKKEQNKIKNPKTSLGWQKRFEWQGKKIDKTNSQIKEIENLTKKEITGYLDNNNNLDKSLLQMDNNKELENITNQMEEWIDKNVKWVKELEKIDNKKVEVKFKKNKSNKNLHWIILEFIIWIILIFISISHINNNLAEFKFIKSSIQLWTNTFQNIVNKVWWIFSDDIQKSYIQKRTTMIEELSNLSNKVNKWCDIKNYKELNYKIESFKASLINTNFTPLDKFIKNYDQYSLYLYSLQELVNKKCNNTTVNNTNNKK